MEPKRFFRSFKIAFIVLLSAMFANAQNSGGLDPTFGNGGRVFSLPIEPYSYSMAFDTVLQPDGRIVVVGFEQLGFDYSWLMLARHLPNGQPDPSFGVGGKVLTSLTGPTSYSSGNDVVLQTDGKIVVIGSVYGFHNSFVARYLQNGNLDPSFSGDGITMIDNAGPGDWGDWQDDIAIQPDGKIILLTSSVQGFTVVRLNSDGAYDNTFGANGRVGTLFNIVNLPAAIVVQADGKIIVAGGAGDGVAHATQFFVLARYNSNGSLDTSFGNVGKIITNVQYSNRPADIVLQPDNKLVVVGNSSFPTGGDGVVMRFAPNGSFDLSFGVSGIVTYRPNYYTALRRVAIQQDGKIVVSSDYPNYRVARFLTNGSLDSSFGSSGAVVTNFPDPFPPNQYISYAGGMSSLAIQPDGKIVGAGYWYGVLCDFFCDNYVAYPAIARYIGNGTTAPVADARFDFDGDHRSDISVFRPSNSVWYLNRSTDGVTSVQFGLSTDRIAAADYDGDGKTDIAIYRDGTWWRLNSGNNTTQASQFGIASDIPVPADYTGDGRDELAVYRNGQWWSHDLSNGQSSLINFGLSDDKPVPADYDGDGEVDAAVFRPSDGSWWVRGSTVGWFTWIFGVATDKPVPGDYTGDGKTDIAVWRPSNGNWYVLRSEDQSYFAAQWGLNGDMPAPGDYDGDGKSDMSVWRPSNGTWYVNPTSSAPFITQFGLSGDRPIPNAFVP